MDQVWKRAAEGKHTIAIGRPSLEVPIETPLTVVRVVCDGTPTTHGPLVEAADRVARLVEDAETSWSPRGREQGEFRRRLIEHGPDRAAEASVVALCNRLAEATQGRAVLAFEGLEHADVATLRALTDIVERGTWLRLPLVLHFRRRPQAQAEETLVGAVRRAAGAEAIVEAPEIAGQSEAPTVEVSGFDPTSLDPRTLRVLRAASIIGPTFETDLLARLLKSDTGTVLEYLQRAADRGAPISDRGDGTLSMSAELLDRLHRNLLPSLSGFWHRKIASLVMHEPEEAPLYREVSPDWAALDAARGRGDFETAPEAEAPTTQRGTASEQPHPFTELLEREVQEPLPELDLDAFEPFREAPGLAVETPDEEPPAPAQPLDQLKQALRRRQGRKDEARAARHLSRVGEYEEATRRYTQAIATLAARGDARRAMLIAEEALETIEPIIATPAGRRLRARVLIELGRAQWHGAGVGPLTTLQQALETLLEAKETMPDPSPVQDRVSVATAIAGVCYDLGDVRSLERALTELSEAAKALQAEGASLQAASLLNDQAAVYLRAGDPVRATHLLSKSREVFLSIKRERADDPMILRELAETEHLLARLPLRARLRPGREDDAYSMAASHARAAAEAYETLSDARELGRVWETLGRLELVRGRLERAAERLNSAASLQERIVDVIGLARTAAAMSDVYVAAEQPREALGVLANSITLNEEKGSPLGLAYNRQAIEALEKATESGNGGGADFDEALSELRARIHEAQAYWGEVPIPGQG